jgi:hypothetical protein
MMRSTRGGALADLPDITVPREVIEIERCLILGTGKVDYPDVARLAEQFLSEAPLGIGWYEPGQRAGFIGAIVVAVLILVHRVIHMIQEERRVNADANNLVTPAHGSALGAARGQAPAGAHG